MPTNPEIIDVTPETALATAQPAALQSVSEIETQIKRLQYLSKQLDLARTACVAVSVPKDWVFHGEGDDAAAYLEGAGGARIAPLIGLKMISRPVVTKATLDKGGYSITCEADFHCSVFDTTYYGVSRTRRSTDQFLSQNGRKEPDEEDIKQAAYTGMIARACQLAAGLSGLTRGELKQRFGFDASGSTSVQYKGGATAAKREDAAQSQSAIVEIDKLLLKLSGGEPGVAADMLQGITFKADRKDADGKVVKGWPGKRQASQLTANGADYVLKVLRQKEVEFDKATVQNEGGAE